MLTQSRMLGRLIPGPRRKPQTPGSEHAFPDDVVRELRLAAAARLKNDRHFRQCCAAPPQSVLQLDLKRVARRRNIPKIQTAQSLRPHKLFDVAASTGIPVIARLYRFPPQLRARRQDSHSATPPPSIYREPTTRSRELPASTSAGKCAGSCEKSASMVMSASAGAGGDSAIPAKYARPRPPAGGAPKASD